MAKPKSTRKSPAKTAAKPRLKSADRTPAAPAQRAHNAMTMAGPMIPDTLWTQLNFAAEPRWYEERDRVVPLLDAILDSPIGREVRFAGESSSWKEATTREAVHQLIAVGKDSSFGMFADPKVPRLQMVLAITHGAFELEFRVHGDLYERRKQTLLDEVGAIAAALRRAGTLGGLRWGFAAPVLRARAGYDYPRPRPPRTDARIPSGAVLDALDVRYHAGDDRDADEGAIRLARAELPAYVRRDEADGLVLLRWTEDLGDIPEPERAYAETEDWMGSHPTSAIARGYNDVGDAREPMRSLEQRPPLTMYDPTTKTGYVAVLLLEDGAPVAEPWQIARTAARDGRLEDGTPVDRVKIIVQLRELALDFTAQARAAGIDAVLYPAEDGTWWNPDPPGRWAYPPRR